MLDEEMDHIIRDAVEKHHPAYNDKAWEKMEKKLDKHLPQKKDRRRYLFFLLLFLLLGGGTFLGIIYLNKNKNPLDKEIAENKKTEQLHPGNKKDQQLNDEPVAGKTNHSNHALESLPGQNPVPAGGNDKNLPGENTMSAGDNNKKMPVNNTSDQAKTGTVNGRPGINPLISSNTRTGTKNNEAVNSLKNKKAKRVKKGKVDLHITATDPEYGVVKNEKQGTKSNMPLQGKTTGKTNITVTAAEPESDQSENKTVIPTELKKENKITIEQMKDSAKTNDPDNNRAKKEKETVKTENKTSSSPDKKKPKKNNAGNFGFTVSAGPDLSFIKLNKPGKAALIYGAGLSYQFKKRVTVRAGFYSSKKIYTATPDQYYIPPGSYYPGLYEVGANCKVYEIPVSLSYHFWQRKNHNWFGNAGLSSFLMKSEKYDYRYKTAYGQYTYKTEIKDKNKHYFAVLTLSAGYQYRFNKWISAQAEPYVKIPLAGVGQGKIKLNSAGILFTVTVNPFAKKK